MSNKLAKTFRGFNACIYGSAGTGKTWSLTTLAQAGMKVVIIFTDSEGENSLLYAIASRKVPLDNFFWSYVPEQQTDWNSLARSLMLITEKSAEDIKKLSGYEKDSGQQLSAVAKCAANFVCDRSGTKLGPVDKLDPSEYVVVLDNLTVLTRMAKTLVLGAKPTASWPELDTAQQVLMNFLQVFVSMPPSFIAIAHSSDEDSRGREGIFIPLGTALRPQFPTIGFGEIFQAKRSGRKYTWEVSPEDATSKKRILPYGVLSPDWAPFVKHLRRKKAAYDMSQGSSDALREEVLKMAAEEQREMIEE